MSNKDYWEKRAEENILAAEKIETRKVKIFEKLWNDCKEDVQDEIIKFYNKYSENNKFDFKDLFKILDEQELQDFKEKAKRYNKKAVEENWQKLYQDQTLSLSLKKKVKRLEELQLVINYILQENYEYEQLNFLNGLIETYETVYNQSMYNLQTGLNIGVSFDKINREALEKIVKTSWIGSNYSDRIWQDKEKLINVLKQELLKGFAMGENPRKIAKRILKKMDVSKHNAERLARTEFNHIANEASFDCVNKINEYFGGGLFTEYKFLATLDNRTSEDCRDLDGKIFSFKDKQVGVNFPPIHPNCRSTYKIITRAGTIGKRIAKRLDTGEVEYIPSDMSYREWEKKFLKE